MIKVSVIIPAYNIEKYIERCLVSIKNQSEKNIEIIVVNDGSTDDTLKVINEVALNDQRFIIIDKKNEGIIEARKSGFDIAKGKYILFVDGDDWISLNAVETLYNYAEINSLDIVINNAWSTDGINKKNFNIFNENLVNEMINDPLKYFLLDQIAPSMCGKLIRRKYITENKIEFVKSLSYGEDLASVAVWFMNSPKVDFIKERFYYYYQRNNSISKKPNEKIIEIIDSVNFIKNKLNECNLLNKYNEEFEKLSYRHIFVSKILRINKIYKYRKSVFDGYKKMNINIEKNKYVKEELNYYNFNYKLRVYLYHVNYYLGELYDVLRGYISK